MPELQAPANRSCARRTRPWSATLQIDSCPPIERRRMLHGVRDGTHVPCPPASNPHPCTAGIDLMSVCMHHAAKKTTRISTSAQSGLLHGRCQQIPMSCMSTCGQQDQILTGKLVLSSNLFLFRSVILPRWLTNLLRTCLILIKEYITETCQSNNGSCMRP